jgi:hypothetical protein
LASFERQVEEVSRHPLWRGPRFGRGSVKVITAHCIHVESDPLAGSVSPCEVADKINASFDAPAIDLSQPAG